MNQRANQDNMRCPNCGSFYTQFLPTCFSLTRQSGRYTPEENEFHELIEKPERRSVFVIPSLVFVGVYFLATMAISLYQMETNASWIRTGSEFSPEVLIPALLLAAVCGLGTWRWASRYNHDEFPGAHDEWSSSAICRRCSTRFEAPDRVVAAYRGQSR